MRRSLIVLALTSSFVTASPNPAGLIDQFWAVLSSLWSGTSGEVCTSSSQTKEGCGWDPYGIKASNCSASLTQDKAGCGWDPYGVNPSDPVDPVDAGCSWDPWGHCISGTQP